MFNILACVRTTSCTHISHSLCSLIGIPRQFLHDFEESIHYTMSTRLITHCIRSSVLFQPILIINVKWRHSENIRCRVIDDIVIAATEGCGIRPNTNRDLAWYSHLNLHQQKGRSLAFELHVLAIALQAVQSFTRSKIDWNWIKSSVTSRMALPVY